MTTNYTKKLTKALDLTLTVTDRGLIVDSCQPECGDCYRLFFDRDENPADVATRIGYEVLSWMMLMEDELDEYGEENSD